MIAQQGFGLGGKDNTDEENQSASFKSVSVISGVTIIGVIFYCFFNSELKRSNLDKERKKVSLL